MQFAVSQLVARRIVCDIARVQVIIGCRVADSVHTTTRYKMPCIEHLCVPCGPCPLGARSHFTAVFSCRNDARGRLGPGRMDEMV
jgi:hypothetical protein